MAAPTEEATGRQDVPSAPSISAKARALLALSRPRQWHKNLLVAAAPAAAGAFEQGAVLLSTLLLFLAMTTASVAVYSLNDVIDVDADRAHSVKRHRPVAAGTLAPAEALVWAAVMAAVSLGISGFVNGAALVVIAIYLVLSSAYAVRFKHVAVLDIVIVATGFFLRALLGAVGNNLIVSSWFLLIALFGALYLVVGKRAAESARVQGSTTSRSVLAQYPEAWLQQVTGVALTGALISYALWAFQDVGTEVFTPILALSVGPFLVALLRYGLLIARGEGERPESLILRDRPLLIAGAVWMVMVGFGIYAA